MSPWHAHLRPMTRNDIAAGMELVCAAGWNQTEADWKRFLEAERPGCFVAEAEGRVCGTVATIVYGEELAWIGMVLVGPRHRGQGIAADLVKLALEHLDARGPLTIKLDATPQGKSIYARCGFEPECEIERWMRTSSSPPPARPLAADAARLEDIVAMDPDIFGAYRGSLLRSLDSDAPEFTMAAWKEGRATGYALGRHGLRADQIGPWTASEQNIARELLQNFLNRSTRGRVVADCLTSHPHSRDLLRSAGFEFSRSFTRMVRGPRLQNERMDMIYAVAGPEFG
ncbi:MAG: GNAT family N-acetyltransferase [Terriglobia bacterium]